MYQFLLRIVDDYWPFNTTYKLYEAYLVILNTDKQTLIN